VADTWPSGLSRVQEAQLLAEQNDRFLSCLREEGIRVEPDDEGALARIYWGNIGVEASNAIRTSCSQQAGPEPEILPATRDELSALYDLHIETKECLEAQGVTVKEPPSRTKWIEDSLSNPEGPWLPYESLGAVAYQDLCPDADLYHLYGVDPNDPDFEPAPEAAAQ
jgi:hypothetical protein